MSTEWVKIQDALDPAVTLEFATGAGGYKFTVESSGPNPHLMKFWFTRESWERLRGCVDAIVEDGRAI